VGFYIGWEVIVVVKSGGKCKIKVRKVGEGDYPPSKVPLTFCQNQEN
jgi:hypothetical protein